TVLPLDTIMDDSCVVDAATRIITIIGRNKPRFPFRLLYISLSVHVRVTSVYFDFGPIVCSWLIC
ncbi:MAG: hypothetical protein WBX81_13560, partial [Nitrososphaeraceae archaeon]